MVCTKWNGDTCEKFEQKCKGDPGYPTANSVSSNGGNAGNAGNAGIKGKPAPSSRRLHDASVRERATAGARPPRLAY